MFPRGPSRQYRRRRRAPARAAAGSQARPHSTSTRETSAPYRWSICASRSPKYPVTTATARAPGFVRFATAVSMPAVPVPETAKENAPSPAWNMRPRRARTSSRVTIISGSRWLSTGACMARMIRGATGLGPGPSSRPSLSGSGQASRRIRIFSTASPGAARAAAAALPPHTRKGRARFSVPECRTSS